MVACFSFLEGQQVAFDGGRKGESVVLMATLVTAQNELSLSWGWAKVDQNCLKTVSKAYQNCMKMIQKFLLFPKYLKTYGFIWICFALFGPLLVR